jgi:L-alanine-DL-glutamate epimerase-like enolase superfamily enzyme
MKVTDVRVRYYEYTMKRPIGDVNGPLGNDKASAAFTFVDTDEGITGVALAGNGAVRGLAPLIVGEDPRGVVGLWKKMQDFVFKGGNEGEAKRAISALDCALWDLKAKINGEPLWRTFGARQGRCKAYASGIDLCLTDDEIHAFYSRMAEKGVDGGKLKVGVDMDEDLRRLGIVKDALSRNNKRPYLMIDANEYWSPKQAVRHVSEFEKHFDIFWVEEPARRWDYKGLRKVSQGIKAAVSTGENINDAGDFYALIANEAADVYNVGTMNTSGATGCMQVASMAAGFELPVSMMNCPGDFSAHLAAALPNHNMMEVVDPGREPCFTVDTWIEDGFIHCGEKPGWGIEIDEAKLKQMEVPSPTRQGGAPFPRREGAGLYIVPFSDEERAKIRPTARR